MPAAVIEPEKLLRELAELWVNLGKEEDSGSMGVLRACSMTLLTLAGAAEDAAAVDETLALLMRDHPSRAIVARVRDSAEAELDAGVRAQCWKPFGQRRHICCEQIAIAASNATLDDLPAVILPLIAPDLPVILWARAPRLFDTPARRELSRMAWKTIVDSASAADPVRALEELARESEAGLTLGDLAWTRLTRWRQLIAQIFENPEYAGLLPSVARVSICHPGAAPTVGVRYMAAWLLQSLESAGSRPEVEWRKAPDAADAGLVRIEFATADPSLLTVVIRKLEGAAVETQVNSITTRAVFSAASDYELLREELAIPRRDPVYEAALKRAARA
jgi:glucose-6-phosphate dehydrogenase assembly protein OpcA